MIKKEEIIALQTLSYKEVSRVFRIWKQTLLPHVVTSFLYFFIFGGILGSQLDKVGNLDYKQFLIPGFIMMNVITASYMNVSSSFFSEKFSKSIEDLLSSPMPNWMIILGFSLGGLTRGVVISFIIFGVSLFFTDISVASPILTLGILIFSSFLFSLAGLFNAFFAKNFDDVSIIPSFVITPLVYLGGVFYSVSELTGFFKTITLLNPIFYIINGFRDAMLGEGDGVNGIFALGIIIILCIILFLINLRMLSSGYLKS